MKFTFTHAAVDDLRSIRAHTLITWGIEQEDRYPEEPGLVLLLNT